jgi:two-component system, sensor histidine kinase and response regulator
VDPNEEHDRPLARAGGEQPPDEALTSRLEMLLDVVTSIAELDFSKRAEIHGDGEFLDGIAYGLNVLSEELRASTISRDYFDGIIRSMAEGLVIVDAHDTITDVNPALATLLGYPPAVLTGMPWAKLCPHPRAEPVPPGAPALTARADGRIETELVRTDGRAVEVALSGSVLRRPNGDDGWMYIVQDITAHKDLARTLASARDAAVHSAQVTASFLANMSHEIRTPLNGVIGMAWLLLEEDRTGPGGFDPAARAQLEAIHECATLLLDIVNDILDLSKLESGGGELDVEVFELSTTIENLLHVYALRAEQKDLDLVSDLAPVLPTRVRGDAGRLRQVLSNLVSNAIKFTERGEVVVEVRPTIGPGRDDAVWLRFEVSDTGIGIAPHLQSTIFEAFTQAETTTARKYGGTGLGLTISKRLVALMGGCIGCSSELGRGSTFWFELPFDRVASDDDADARNELLAGRSVLVIDDNPRQQRALARAIAGWGGQPVLARDGAEALELSRAAEVPPSLAIVEWSSSSRGELLAELAALSNGAMQIVLSTLLSSTDSAAIWSSRGVLAALPKPVKLSRLRGLLQGAVEGPGERAQARASGAARPQPALGTLLVVEDNPVNQTVILGQLRRLGLTAQVVDDGSKAVEAVARHRFAAVLMDLYMPAMDGYEATEQIRRHPHGAELPIIAVTANATEQVRSRCLAVGMDDFLSKPLRIGHLSKCLSRWLRYDFLGLGFEPSELDAPAAPRVPEPSAELVHGGAGLAHGGAELRDGRVFAADARVLVVDDDPINRRVLAGMLKRLQITVDEAVSGEEAVAAVAARRYGVVLMDVEMPGGDGLAATRRIRGVEPGRRTPILAVTAHNSRHEKERCAAADMDDFLTKPLRMTELVMRLALWLGPAPRPDQRSVVDQLTTGDVLRWTSFSPLAPLVRSPGLGADLREHFLGSCRDRLECLRRAASTAEAMHDPDDVSGRRRDVFALVTWLTNLGALSLAGLAAMLDGGRLEDRAIMLGLLDRELSRLALS